jgi:hypothetical protein
MCVYINLPAQVGRGAEATRLGRLVHEHSLRPGAHCTPAAEEGNDVLSHIKGKYGELAFYDWLKAQGFEPTHTPFRDDYTEKDSNDDFIVNTQMVIMRPSSQPAFPEKRVIMDWRGRRGQVEHLRAQCCELFE